MELSKLDYIVLTVTDLNKTVIFYTTVLGMEKSRDGLWKK